MGLFDRIKRAFTGEDEIVEQQRQSESPSQDQIVFEKYDKGVEKTRRSFSDRMNELFAGFRQVDDEFFDDLEETFISSDVGFDMTLALSDAVREEIQRRGASSGEQVKDVIIEKMVEIYDKGGEPNVEINENPDGPTVVLFVGVNGVGKTTTIGKMAYQLKQDGKKVLLAAGDTFRAGAIEQLEEWARRIDVPIVTGKAQGDPASVAFDAAKTAREGGYDYLLVDTAGRLQTKINLMNELDKMKRILTRELPGSPHEILLVLDATTGQNA